MASILLGLIFYMVSGGSDKQDSDGAGWTGSGETVIDSVSGEVGATEPVANDQGDQTSDSPANADPPKVQDGFLLADGGTFLMGSPESDNRRIQLHPMV